MLKTAEDAAENGAWIADSIKSLVNSVGPVWLLIIASVCILLWRSPELVREISGAIDARRKTNAQLKRKQQQLENAQQNRADKQMSKRMKGKG